MTDKGIIIDGVDVSGCFYYRDYGEDFFKEHCWNTNLAHGTTCTNLPECLYKQRQRITAQYNTVVDQNKSLQSELLLARSEVSQKTDYIREQLEIIKQLKDKNRELRIEIARLSNELTFDIKKQLKQKENEIAHQKTLTETYRACYLAKYEDLAKELENKKQECEELKEELELNTQNAVVIDMTKRLYSYKQALDEIESTALYSDTAPCLEHGCDCSNCEDESTENGERCMQYGLEKILDIINKAKEVNNAG